MALGKDFPLIQAFSFPDRLELARRTMSYLLKEGEYSDMGEQLAAMGPYAWPVLVAMATAMTEHEQATLKHWLHFRLDLDAPPSKNLRAFDKAAYLGHRKSKVLPSD